MYASLANSSTDQATSAPSISEEDRAAIRRWNDTSVDYPRNANIADLFAQQCARAPHCTAVVFEGKTWTYAQLNSQAERVAKYLLAQGLGHQSVVGIMVPRSLEMVAAMLGVLKIGGTYVPLEPSYPDQRLQFMVEDTKVQWLLTHTEKRSVADSLPVSAINLDELLSADSAKDTFANIGLPECSPASAEEACYIVFTSGSTGRPKGAAIPHRGVVRMVRSATWIDFHQDDVFLQHSSQSFDLSVFEVWGPLLNGARVVVAPPHMLSLEELGRTIVENRVSTLWLTSGLFHQMVNHRVQDLAGVRFLLAGGDIVSAVHAQKLLESCPSTTFVNCYGPTENSTFCTYLRIPSLRDLPDGPLPIGRALPLSTHYILDEQGDEVPVGTIGEIYCGGDGLALGYVNRPELTEERFAWHTFSDGQSERLYKTGDLGAWRGDGTIEFHGRADRQVKVRGFRVELGEIEAALHDHPQIAQATVLVDTDSNSHKRLVAYVAVGNHAAPCACELKKFLADRMPEYMIPTFFVPLAKLPLNSNGKVDYRALPKPTRDLVCAAGSEESLTPGQQQLVAIWEEVFQVKGLSLADDFFALGGDSMVAIVLLAKVESHFGKSLALTDLMQASSIGTFAELLGQNDEGSLRFDAVSIRTGNAPSPLFFVPCIHGNLFTIRELARALPPGKAIYGLQPIGIDGQGTPHETIDEIASHYLRQVQAVQPNGPYTLVGYSLGGTVSVRMAQMLQEQGHTVESLILIDPPRRWRPAWITAIQHMVHRTKDLLRWALWQVGFRNRPTPVPLPHQKMLEAHVRAITNYVASPYHGNVLLLEHTESEGVLKDGLDNFLALNDWSDILPAETRHAKIPGNHTTMFQGKNVQHIAAEVQSELGLGKVVVVSQATSHQQMATA